MPATSSTPPLCPLCQREAEPIFAPHTWTLREGGRVFRYVECPACDAMFSDPLPTAEEIDWLYQHRYDYSWFIRRQGLKRLQAGHRWARLRALFADLKIGELPRRMLDVGGGHAWFLRAARADGWNAEGLELLNDELVATAKVHGVTIHHGSLLAHSLPAKTFGLVTAWHVIEHISDIQGATRALAELVAPGGVLVIAVPNYRSAGMKREGLGWVWCQKPFVHPWHLSPAALKALLPPSLEILAVTTRDTWDAQWAQTTIPYRYAMKAIYAGALFVRHKAGRKKLADDLQFWAEEGLRLATYAGYLLLRPFFRGSYERALDASELMIIARKKAAL